MDSTVSSTGRTALHWLLLPLLLLLCTCVRAQRTDPCALNLTLGRVASSCNEVTLTPDALDYRLGGGYREVSWIFISGAQIDTIQGENFGTYTFRSSGSITLRATSSCKTVQRRVTVSVEPSRQLQLSGAGEYCSGSDPVQLAANVAGGIWIGEGIIDPQRGIFDPGAAPIGVSTVSYTVVEGNCPYFGELQVAVLASEEVESVDTTVCRNSGLLHLEIRPGGGYWSGNGIVDSLRGTFDPLAVGPGNYSPSYVYRDQSGCTVRVAPRVVVQRPPTLPIADTVRICRRDTSLDLNALLGVSHRGSSMSYRMEGDAIANRRLNPLVDLPAVGTYSLQATLTEESCAVTKTVVLQVKPLPELLVDVPPAVCISAGVATLSASLSGGHWEGPGVNAATGTVDLRRAGPGTRQYTYTHATGTPCAQQRRVELRILAETEGLTAGPDISLCAGTQQELSLEGAHPAGGTFSGTGLRGSTVDVSMLHHDTTYTYTYSVAVRGGCGGTATRELRIESLPAVSVEAPDTVCVGQEVRLEVAANGGTLTYNLGNGERGTGFPHGTSYPRGDTTYRILLTVTNRAGCQAEISRSIFVRSPPVASFTLAETEGCAPLKLQPQDRSQSADGGYWLVAGQVINGALSDHVLSGFTRDTSVSVERVVSNDCGTDRASRPVRINAQPRANFALDRSEACPPFQPQLTNTSTGSATAYHWTFGQGDGSRQPTPTAPSYPGRGGETADYDILLRAANSCGADTLRRRVRVLATTVRAAIELDARVGCAPFEVQPVSGSTPGTLLAWSLLDSTGRQIAAAANERAPTFSIERAGRYVLVLQAKGCGSSRDSVSLTVRPGPQLAIQAPERVCRRDTITLGVDGPELTGYDWRLGGRGSSSAATPRVAFVRSGMQTVELVATGRQSGCVHHLVKTIEVLPDPVVRPLVSDSVGCAPLAVRYSVAKPDGALSYVWDLGTDADAVQRSASEAIYAVAGRYQATVRVTDAAGCSAAYTAPAVTVRRPPEANFAARVDLDPEVLGDVTFRNLSAEADRFEWFFGDSTGSTRMEPGHAYATYGEYAVRLVATADYPNGRSCSDTLVRRVRPERFGRFFVPSALAPEHGIGEPSVWGAKGYAVAQYDLRVYSAHGRLVYRTDEVEAGIPTGRWDGTLGGGGSDPAPQGTYTWRATVTYLDGQRDNLLGTVTLVR